MHNQFVASALATKKLHEIDPDAKMGNMLCRLENYAESPKPEDQLQVIRGSLQLVLHRCAGHR